MNNPKKNKTSASLMAGAAKIDITPPLGTFINGDFVAHYATHIHDSLYAKALVLKYAEVTIAMIVVDICVMSKEFLDQVKSSITAKTGIPHQHILISSTHTHAAGSVSSVYLSAADIPYMEKLPRLITKAAEEAKKNMRSAKLAFGNVNVPRHVRCRRYLMKNGFKPINPVDGSVDTIKTNPFDAGQMIKCGAAETDPQVSYLLVKGTDDRWISVLANYSLHYVGDWDNGTITADYFGVFSRHLQKKIKAGDDFVGMMSNGTSGDINIWDFQNTENYPTGNFKKSEFIGKDIAEKVVASLGDIQWEAHPSIQVGYNELLLKIRKPDIALLKKAKAIIAKSSYENLQINDEGLRKIYAREQVLLNELPNQLPFPLQVIKIGNGIIGALGGEIFAETGLWLKEKMPAKKYFTIGLANGNLGYVPPAHEMESGGYETWRSRTSKMEKNAEEKIKKRLLSMIGELKQQQ